MAIELTHGGWPKNKEDAAFLFGETAWFCRPCNAWHGKNRSEEEKADEVALLEEKLARFKMPSNANVTGAAPGKD